MTLGEFVLQQMFHDFVRAKSFIIIFPVTDWGVPLILTASCNKSIRWQPWIHKQRYTRWGRGLQPTSPYFGQKICYLGEKTDAISEKYTEILGKSSTPPSPFGSSTVNLCLQGCLETLQLCSVSLFQLFNYAPLHKMQTDNKSFSVDFLKVANLLQMSFTKKYIQPA